MSKKKQPAVEVAKHREGNSVWIDHAEINESDLDWLQKVERLTLWNVSVPDGFLSRIPHLWWLDVRGGTSNDLKILFGLSNLKGLAVNQIRGLTDLSSLAELSSLRFIELYGLPKVERLPCFSCLPSLERVNVGQMRGLNSLTEILQAPQLQELQLSRKIAVTQNDVQQIISHPTLKRFTWFAEDVPVKVWKPVVDQISYPPVRVCRLDEWFDQPSLNLIDE